MPLAEAPAARVFRQAFSVDPKIAVRAPGRVNLIGDHTDYHDGFVLPMAINQELTLAMSLLDQPTVQLTSEQFGEAAFRIDQDTKTPGWAAYVQGVMRELDFSSGARIAVSSSIPAGAGLSSSAAIEMATAIAISALTDRDWDPAAAALAGQHAENEWVGMQCGIMDQLASAAGRAGHALLIDCGTLAIEPIPIPDTVQVVVLDTRSARTLVGSEYNDRRQESAAAAAALGLDTLRDASENDLDTLSGVTLARARHVVSENRRVLGAARALRAGDVDALGHLMTDSHASLRDDYEVSSPALDAMVTAASQAPGLIGVRMTGGGFGGCCVALVQQGQADQLADVTLSRYRELTGTVGRAYVTRAADGASILEER